MLLGRKHPPMIGLDISSASVKLVEGPMRDPASLNKPSTREIGAANMIGTIPGTDVHWGLAAGVLKYALSGLTQGYLITMVVGTLLIVVWMLR